MLWHKEHKEFKTWKYTTFQLSAGKQNEFACQNFDQSATRSKLAVERDQKSNQAQKHINALASNLRGLRWGV